MSLPSVIDPEKAADVVGKNDALKILVGNDLTNIASKLYSRSIISKGVLGKAMIDMRLASDRTVELLGVVEGNIRADHESQVFLKFVKVLESESHLRAQAKKLVESYLQATRIQDPVQAATVPSREPNLPPQTGGRMQLDGQEPTDEADLPGADSASQQLDQAANGPSQTSEEPALGEEDLHKIAVEENLPITKVLKTQDPTLYRNVQKFRKDVKVLVHTVNENEKWAVYDLLKAPPFAEKPVDLFEPNWITLGMFGGYKAAMIQTEQGARARRDIWDALKHFPNAKVIMAVGVLCGLDRNKCKLGDVIVSEFIDGVANYKFAKDGRILIRPSSGRHKPVSRNLVRTFARGEATWGAKGGFKCTKDGQRKSKVYPGEIISGPALLDNKDVLNKVTANAPEARAVEMEGYVLGEIEEDAAYFDDRELGVVVIKAVSDFGDGTKGKEWQLTAAMAAAQYAEHKLERTEGKLFVEDGGGAVSIVKSWVSVAGFFGVLFLAVVIVLIFNSV